MNWIKLLFGKKETTEQCDIHVVSCSLDYQVKRRREDYLSLIKSNRRDAELYCKEPIIEWGENGKEERQEMRERFDEYEDFLRDKIRNLELILDAGKNCN